MSVWLRRGVATKVIEDVVVAPVGHAYTFRLGDDGSGERWALWDEQDGERFVGRLTPKELSEFPQLEIYDELALVDEIRRRSGFDDCDEAARWYGERWAGSGTGR